MRPCECARARQQLPVLSVPSFDLATCLSHRTPLLVFFLRSKRQRDPGGGIACSEIVERVLCKASRTTSGSDSYFTVEQLFTNSDYLLKKRSERLPPINVEVSVENSSGCCGGTTCVLRGCMCACRVLRVSCQGEEAAVVSSGGG